MTITYREYIFQPDFPFACIHHTCTARQADFIHFHNCLEIALCDQGTMQWNVEGQDFLLHPDEFCLVPPFATHCSFHPLQDNPVSCRYFFLDPSRILLQLYPNGIPEEFNWYQYGSFSGPLSKTDFPEAIGLLYDLITEAEMKPDLYRFRMCADVQYLMILLCRKLYKKTAQPENSSRADRASILPAIQLLNEQYFQPPACQTLAQVCCLTQKRFLRNFQNALGKTPAQYVRQIRIDMACSELVRTEKPIVEIAYEVGFSSLSSFNRNFHQITGQSPTSFRSEKREIRKDNTTHSPYQTTLSSSITASV